jgi:hypothetical protein
MPDMPGIFMPDIPPWFWAHAGLVANAKVVQRVIIASGFMPFLLP